MENIELFSNLGIAGAALAIIWFIVRYFVEAMTKKDAYIEKTLLPQIVEQTKEFTKQTASFNLTVKNHMSHSTKALNKLAKAVDHLAENSKKKK